MDIKLTKIDKDFIIGGFSIETTFEDNDKDLEILYNDFIHNGKMEYLNKITQNRKEYHLATWYTNKNEGKFKYLLGQKINEKEDNLEIKTIKNGEYAVSKFPPKYYTFKAWTEIYNEGIPGIGYKFKEPEDIAFKYYPSGFDGEYELWVLVEKSVIKNV